MRLIIDDTRIYLITFKDDKGRVFVSHGVGNNTLENYCLPPEPLSAFKPSKDENGVYISA